MYSLYGVYGWDTTCVLVTQVESSCFGLSKERRFPCVDVLKALILEHEISEDRQGGPRLCDCFWLALFGRFSGHLDDFHLHTRQPSSRPHRTMALSCAGI